MVFGESKMAKQLDKKATETLIALTTSDTITEAAQKLGIARKNLYERINRYGLKEHLEEIQTSTLAELVVGSKKAAKKLIEHLDNNDANVSIKASTEILDRTGVTKSNNNTSGVNINFNNYSSEQRTKYDLYEI